MKYAVWYVKDHPGQTALRRLVKFFDFWGLERELIAAAGEGFFGPIPKAGLVAMAAVIFGSYAAMLFLGLFGMVVTPPSDWCPHLLLVLAMALICGLHTLTFGHSRYHLPVMPLVMVYAAAAWADRSAIWVRRRQPAFVLACALRHLRGRLGLEHPRSGLQALPGDPGSRGLNAAVLPMLRCVTPHLRLETVLDLDAARVRSLGLDGLLLDLDCTLKDYRAARSPPTSRPGPHRCGRTV